VAPSFPAEFVEHDYQVLVGMLRALGFDLSNEVAFGADLVAAEYRRLLSSQRTAIHRHELPRDRRLRASAIIPTSWTCSPRSSRR
jgi:hypothetical protein